MSCGEHGDDGKVVEDGDGHQAVVGVGGFRRGEIYPGLFVYLHANAGGLLEFGEL